ncbi:8-oxo-dGTP diphosphatase [Oceanobacillus limi]|uniref:8-oxo-dGTP diphosphatase n=1 Tax=Oceanobacillus limi TaxID=930131 RepID=A0A1I0FGC4_9BACI|nr:NUDIX domain-containing protein [Oceanobacillus limi]SET56572.1 8-oxo-dGTP diphosphatase [Oceanobacillus limi]
MISFGKKEWGKTYIFRPAVYGILFTNRKKKVALIQTNDVHFFLPGGGIEKNESHKECLIREAKEEMGMKISIGQFIGSAQQYFYSKNEDTHYLNRGYFYLCDPGKLMAIPVEEDHNLIWIDTEEAIMKLVHEHQRWAVQKSLGRLVTSYNEESACRVIYGRG